MSVRKTRSRHSGGSILVHPLVVRITHWLNAAAILMMVSSGWGIYNASPLLPFHFPAWAILGGWLGGSIAWHLAAMWLLCANGLIYVGYGLSRGHFRRSFLPVTPAMVVSDLWQALRFRLPHALGHYNAVQKLLYVVVLLLGLAAVLSGLSLWKPVQLQTLVALMGGYPVVRWVHFVAMAGIVGFVLVHLALVALVPRTLPAMITGRAGIDHADGEAA